jgi:hypothetical protein
MKEERRGDEIVQKNYKKLEEYYLLGYNTV